MSANVFYQDFLFRDMITAKDGYPDIEYDYSDYVAGRNFLRLGYEQTDKELNILLTDLMNITKENKWNDLERKANQLDELMIVDDINLKNSELEDYKTFYIKTYLWKLNKLCRCRVTRKTE